MRGGREVNARNEADVSKCMNPRSVALTLALLLSVSAAAQLPQKELAISLGRWDSDQLGNGPAFGLSYNRFWTRSFSTRFGRFVAREGDTTAGVAHASAEVHPFRASRVSPWAGVGIAGAYTRRAASNDHFTGSETTLTGIYRGGLDVMLSPRFALGGEFSYMKYEAELGSRFGNTVDVDPVTVMLSGRWRF